MERARQQGKRIGRPSVNERPRVLSSDSPRWCSASDRESFPEIKLPEKLGISYATLKRLLQAWEQPNAKAIYFTFGETKQR